MHSEHAQRLFRGRDRVRGGWLEQERGFPPLRIGGRLGLAAGEGRGFLGGGGTPSSQVIWTVTQQRSPGVGSEFGAGMEEGGRLFPAWLETLRGSP